MLIVLATGDRINPKDVQTIAVQDSTVVVILGNNGMTKFDLIAATPEEAKKYRDSLSEQVNAALYEERKRP